MSPFLRFVVGATLGLALALLGALLFGVTAIGVMIAALVSQALLLAAHAAGLQFVPAERHKSPRSALSPR